MGEEKTLNNESNNYKIYLNGKLFIDDDPEVLLEGYDFDDNNNKQPQQFSNFETPKN